MNSKTLKLIQIFESMVPKRTEEVLSKEYSEDILKEIKNREEEEQKQKELQDAPKLAIEGENQNANSDESKKDVADDD